MWDYVRSCNASTDLAFRRNPLGFMKEIHGQHGAVCKAPVFGATTVFCAPPATNDLFNVEPDHLVVHNTPLVHELFGEAVFNLGGDDHARARRAVSSGVGPRAVHEYSQALQSIVEHAAGDWVRSGVADAFAMARSLTLRGCEQVMFGVNSETSDGLPLRKHLDRFSAGAELASQWRAARPRYWLARNSGNALRELAEGVVSDAARAGSAAHRIAGVLTDQDRTRLGDHMLAVLIAARETTASLITWSIIEICKDSALSDELRQEVAAFAGYPTGVLVDQRAPKLHATLLEVERRHAPNAISLRRAVAHCRIYGANVEPGWLVAYSPSADAFDDQRFPDAACFDANRFRSSDGRLYQPRNLLTFGGGRHACPGRKFAETVTLLFLAEVLRRYELRLASPGPIALKHLPVKAPRRPVALKISPT